MNIFFLGWLIVSLLFLLFEAGHPGLFYFISFAGGAVFAAATSLIFPSSFFLQGSLFLIASVITLIALRYWVADSQHTEHERTNIYALPGQRAFVTKRITINEPGEVKVKGEFWLARTENDEALEPGEWVQIVKISGASVFVVKDSTI